MPHDQIKARLSIPNDNYFRKAKSEAFRALRQALQAVIQDWIGTLLS